MTSLNPFIAISESEVSAYPVKITLDLDTPSISVLIHLLNQYGGKVSIGDTYQFEELQWYVKDTLKHRDCVALVVWVSSLKDAMDIIMLTRSHLTAYEIHA
jgi:hypothetical protein